MMKSFSGFSDDNVGMTSINDIIDIDQVTSCDWDNYKNFMIKSIKDYYMPRGEYDKMEYELKRSIKMFEEDKKSVEFIINVYDFCNNANIDIDDGLISSMKLSTKYKNLNRGIDI